MFRYRSFGLSIQSELEFPDLPPAHEEPDVFIRLGSVDRTIRKATLHEEVGFNELAGAFHIKNGNEIVVDPLPGVKADLLRVLILGRMMAFLMRQRGWLSLHASGVVINGHTVLFLGESGSGKSTTSAAFHVCGCPVVTDDVGAVRVVDGRCVVCRVGSRLRLLSDARTVLRGAVPEGSLEWDKYSYDLQTGIALADVLPVSRIYVLEYGDRLESSRMSELAAVAFLSTHSFIKRRRMDSAALESHLRDCCSVASVAPLFRLSRTRSLHALPELAVWVQEDVKT